MTAIASDYWQNWPTHCCPKMLPLPHGCVDSFWDEAWAQIQVEPNALILSTNEWTLAELRTAATRAAFRIGQPLVLPTMQTVEQWCDAAIAPDAVRVSSYARTLTIDTALAEAPTQLLGAISGVTRRALASTLAQLIDALDIAQFPTSSAAQALLEATTNQPFAQRELAIAQAIAAALADVPGRTQQRLQGLRQNAAHTPLILLALDKASFPIMRAVAKSWAGPVTILLIDWTTAPLSLDGQAAVSSEALSTVAKQIEIISAPHLEAHADAAARTVVRLRQTNPRIQITLIALDRRAARRTRALLDRAGIAVADASGWRMSTTAATASVMRFLDIVQHEQMADVLDWAKLPWVAASSLGIPPEALIWLEQFVRSRALSQDLQRISQRIRLQAASELQGKALVLIEWLESIKLQLNTHRTVGAHAKLLAQILSPLLDQAMKDAAGSQMLAHLQQLSLDPAEQSIPLEGFYAVLDAHFEAQHFALPTEDAQIRILPLGVAVWRPSDHIIVLGAQQGQWPQPRPPAAILSWAQQAQLGLAEHDDGMDSARVLIARTRTQNLRVTFIHTRSHPDATFEASPWLELLRLQTKQAGIELVWKDWAAVFSKTEFSPMGMPKPLAPALPAQARLSVSALEALLACPYRFFALRLLGLKNLEALDETPDRRDFGVLAHAWLLELHKAQLLGKPNNVEHLKQAEELLEKVLRNATKGSLHPAQFEAFRALLSRLIPSLLQWAQTRQSSSALAETSFVRHWKADAQPIELYGRLDRVEISATGANIIDYKTASESTLKNRARAPAHYPQLLLYAYLVQNSYPIKEIAFVSIGAGAGGYVGHIAQAGDIQELISHMEHTLEAGLRGLQAGLPLPAHGTQTACQYCEARGICRKDYWERPNTETVTFKLKVAEQC